MMKDDHAHVDDTDDGWWTWQWWVTAAVVVAVPFGGVASAQEGSGERDVYYLSPPASPSTDKKFVSLEFLRFEFAVGEGDDPAPATADV